MQEAIDEAEAQAQGGVLVTRKVKLPPGQYCRFAVAGAQLALLNDVLALEPPAVIQPGARKPVPAVGSHRCAPLPLGLPPLETSAHR